MGEWDMKNVYIAIIEPENDIYLALCPELDIASQGANRRERTHRAIVTIKSSANIMSAPGEA
jgi:hypothetical protein